MSKDSVDSFTKVWTDRMDDVFKRHIGKNVKPYILTNIPDILAICLGMGIASFKNTDNGLKLVTDKPVSIRWNGEKFLIAQNQMEKK